MSSKQQTYSARTHRKFFVTNKARIPPVLTFLLVVLFAGGALLLYPKILTFGSEVNSVQISLNVLIPLGVLLAAISFICLFCLYIYFPSRENLKGMPLTTEKDLACNVHYKIIAVFTEKMGAKICRICVTHPYINSLNPMIDSVALEKAAKIHGVVLRKGLVFGKKEDGTLFFLQSQNEEVDESITIQEGEGG